MSLRRRIERAEAAANVSPILTAAAGALRALDAVDQVAGATPALRGPLEDLRGRLVRVVEVAELDAASRGPAVRFTFAIGAPPPILAALAALRRVEAGEAGAVAELRQDLDRLATWWPELDQEDADA